MYEETILFYSVCFLVTGYTVGERGVLSTLVVFKVSSPEEYQISKIGVKASLIANVFWSLGTLRLSGFELTT